MLTKQDIQARLEAEYGNKDLKKVLIIPPDLTRMHSYAGEITKMLYAILHEKTEIDILPALGTHEAMTDGELTEFFGDIPKKHFLVHRWREDVVKIGEVPASFVSDVSEGLVNTPIDVEVNKRLLDPDYDLIISVGQVVPHEVVGMANHAKNIFVGCGGSSMISSSHMLGAFYGMERMMGREDTPVRKVFDYAAENFLKIPLTYILTVCTAPEGKVQVHEMYTGPQRENFSKACVEARKHNLTFVNKPFETCVVYLDPTEFKSTWLGNKAIYRTRMAMADGGHLIVLAPGVSKFGEDSENDVLIRKYGYCGRKKVLDLVKTEKDLQENLSVAAHLIHGSSDDRFKITYCTKLLTKEEVEAAGFSYIPYEDAVKMYTPDTPGAYYIPNPALGLWTIE